MISPNMVSAIKVQFLKPIFDEDFPEKGMVAWLTDIEWDIHNNCYKLWFDFTEFEAENDKYFKPIYFPNAHTKDLEVKTGRKSFTAKEAGYYNPKYSVFFSCTENGYSEVQDDEQFVKEILQYLKEVN